MKGWSSASIFSSILLFLGAAVPGQATIAFTSSLTGGDVTTAASPLGPNDPILAYTAYFDTMVVSGAPSNNGTYTPLYLNELYDPSTYTLTVTGSVTMNGNPLPGLAGVTTLVTITFASDLTANTSGGGFSMNFPTDVTSITFSSTLLADLGLSGSGWTLAGLSDGADIGGDPGSFTSVAPTLFLTQGGSDGGATPEPGSWVMTTLGLASIAYFSRKRQSKGGKPFTD